MLQKGILSAQLVYRTVAKAVSLLGQPVLILMHSCNGDLDLLKRLALTQIDSNVTPTYFRQSSCHCVAKAYQICVVENHW